METKTLTVNKLRWPLIIHGRATGDDQVDADGFPITTYSERFGGQPIWAQKDELDGTEKAAVGQEITSKLVRFYCRYHEGITRDDEVDCNGTRYAIVSINSDETGGWMEILCRLKEAPLRDG